MELRINPNELKGITDCLGKLKQQFQAVTTDKKLLNSVGQLLVSRGKQNLEDGGTEQVSYPLLKPATQRQKRRLGYSLKPLQRTGLMKRSLGHEVSDGLVGCYQTPPVGRTQGGNCRPPCLYGF